MSSRRPRRIGARTGAAACTLLLLASCAKKNQVVQGECRPVNGADVCAWGETAGATLVSFGATVPVGAIENAPLDAPMVMPPVRAATIPLPEAVATATGFKTLTVYWEAHGHPPAPFMVPHFDFHFYTMTGAEVDVIDCADSTKAAQLPGTYQLPDIAIPGMGTLIGLCVPQMGMHALPAADLSGTAPFQHSMVMGYYHGASIFVEPMISRAALMERHSFDLDVPAVAGLPAGVHHPTHFRAEYDSTAQSYRFVFTGMAP